MILPIIKHPNEILNTKCVEVKKITKAHKKLINNMIKTMEKNNGIGLAAPQVGISERILIAQDYDSGKIYSMINPIIASKGNVKSPSKEGCLSIPNVEKIIDRYEVITVEYTNIKGVRKREMFKPHLSFVIQHEIDHLDGKLIIDY